MANANLKPRRSRAQSIQHVAALQDARTCDSTLAQARRIAFPWMQITDDLLAHAGFLPGQHVLFSVDYRVGRISITPDHHYMIAGVAIIP
ncbi:MAG TPA: hypothetical protein VF446_03190 [Trinickia sp.]